MSRIPETRFMVPLEAARSKKPSVKSSLENLRFFGEIIDGTIKDALDDSLRHQASDNLASYLCIVDANIAALTEEINRKRAKRNKTALPIMSVKSESEYELEANTITSCKR